MHNDRSQDKTLLKPAPKKESIQCHVPASCRRKRYRIQRQNGYGIQGNAQNLSLLRRAVFKTLGRLQTHNCVLVCVAWFQCNALCNTPRNVVICDVSCLQAKKPWYFSERAALVSPKHKNHCKLQRCVVCCTVCCTVFSQCFALFRTVACRITHFYTALRSDSMSCNNPWPVCATSLSTLLAHKWPGCANTVILQCL